MSKERYLTKPQQYALVYRKGRSSATDLLVMRFLPNALALSRCGFSVSKRLGKAVIRNRVKRRLREIWRVIPLKPGWDIVFIARPAAAGAGFAELKGTVERLLSRAGLLETGSEDDCLAGYKTVNDGGDIAGSRGIVWQ